ncbi:hypothetical protein Aglo03_13100 [Actinokineospora globicatena]|uniref:Uncharacterized protein n=1 Tax=Actinokineospora globicatena TaxID=103729 RepID=A0A9W6QKZ9_9PSEU|nr:hypothetical protein Aglo03_13100 [Actinokineospora globicatena]
MATRLSVRASSTQFPPRERELRRHGVLSDMISPSGRPLFPDDQYRVRNRVPNRLSGYAALGTPAAKRAPVVTLTVAARALAGALQWALSIEVARRSTLLQAC